MRGSTPRSPGIVTTHDEFAISWSEEEARQKVDRFLATQSEGEARSIWRLCRQAQWNYTRAKEELATGSWQDEVRPVLYRPFDTRWTVFNRNVAVHRRARVTDHLLSGPNVALITSRLTKGESFAHIQATRVPPEAICMSPKTSNNGFVFPLYLYPASTGKQRRLLIPGETMGRRANLNPVFVTELEHRLGLAFVEDGAGDGDTTFGPEDVFNYVYAVLHAPGYRSRYAQFLRHDFPRIPIPETSEMFQAVAKIGAELVALHLLDAEPPIDLNYPVPGSNVVDPRHPRYLAPGELDEIGRALDVGRVYISSDDTSIGKRGQYFRGVRPEVWAYEVGGYRVCEKWLKDRRGKTLSLDDLGHYERIVATVDETLKLVSELDELIPHWPLDRAIKEALPANQMAEDLLAPAATTRATTGNGESASRA